jgi:NADPH:quinone reductase
MNKVILLKKRPVGRPSLNDFEFSSASIPVPQAGNILLQTLYVSVDPYLRGRMNDSKSYIPSFKTGEPMQSGIIAQVIDSKHAEFSKGDIVSGNLEWKEYQVSDGNGLTKVDAKAFPL